jgi:hypothetical protein
MKSYNVEDIHPVNEVEHVPKLRFIFQDKDGKLYIYIRRDKTEEFVDNGRGRVFESSVK